MLDFLLVVEGERRVEMRRGGRPPHCLQGMGVFVTHTEIASYHAHYELVGIDLLTVEIGISPGMRRVKEDHNKCF